MFTFKPCPAAVCGLVMFSLFSTAPAATAGLPNFVVIMADDLGYGDTGTYGGWIDTPELDRMAATGLKFTDFHASGNVCSPTRAGLMTGRYQQRAGIPSVVGADPKLDEHHHGLYPLYTDMSFGIGGRKLGNDFAIEAVRLSISGQTLEKAVTPEDTHASFTLELEAGDADLETALIGDGKDGVAYFVTVQYNGP